MLEGMKLVQVCDALLTLIREPITVAVLFWMFFIVLAQKVLCVLTIVTVFDKKLQKVMKTLQHIQVQNMSVDRMHYNNHGMQKNSNGKAWITEETVKKIQDLFSLKQVSTPIPLCWKGINDISTSLNNDLQSTGFDDILQNNEAVCTINRFRN